MEKPGLHYLDNLTPRELEVLALITEGKTNKQIAAELVIETSTLEKHLRHIYPKLNVSNRTQAAIFALLNGIIQPKDREHLFATRQG